MSVIEGKLGVQLECSLCGDLCKRGVRVECCGAQCCRACGVKTITSTRACWSKHCGKLLSTADLHNDEDLRDAVQSYKKKGVLEQAWRDILTQKLKVYHEHSVAVSDKVIHGPNSDLMDGKESPVRKKFVLASKLRGRSWDTYKEDKCFSMRGTKGANRMSRSLDSYRKPRATSMDNRPHLLDRRKYGGTKAGNEVRKCFVALSGHNEREYSQRKGNSSKTVDNAYLNSPVKTEHTVFLDSGIKTENESKVCPDSDAKSGGFCLVSGVKTEDIVCLERNNKTVDNGCQQVGPKTNDNDNPVVCHNEDSKSTKTVCEKAVHNVDSEDGSNAVDTGGGSNSGHNCQDDNTQAFLSSCQNVKYDDSIKIVSAELNDDHSESNTSGSVENILISFPQSKEKEHIDVSKHLASGASELNVYVPSKGCKTTVNNDKSKKNSSEPIHGPCNDASFVKDSAHSPSSAQIVTDEFSIFSSTSKVESGLLCESNDPVSYVEEARAEQFIVSDENIKYPISCVKKCRVDIKPIHGIKKSELNNASNIDKWGTDSADYNDQSLENEPSILDIGAESVATQSITMDDGRSTEAAITKTTNSISDSYVLEYQIEGVKKCWVDIKSLKATNIDEAQSCDYYNPSEELDLNECCDPADKGSDEESIVNYSCDNDDDSDGRTSIQENPFCIDAVTRPESDDESDSEVYVRPLNRIEMSKLREAVEAVSENLRRDSGCSFVPKVTPQSRDCDKKPTDKNIIEEPTDKNIIEDFPTVSAPDNGEVLFNSQHDAIHSIDDQKTLASDSRGEAKDVVINEEAIVQHLDQVMSKCNINGSKQCRVDIKSINAFEVREALEQSNYEYISPIETSSESEDPDSSDENSDGGPTIHENPYYNPDTDIANENVPINTVFQNLPTNCASNFEEGKKKESCSIVLLDKTEETSNRCESNIQSATTKNCRINIKSMSSIEVAEVQLGLTRAEDLEHKKSLINSTNLEGKVHNTENMNQERQEDCSLEKETSLNDHILSIQSESILNASSPDNYSENLFTDDDNEHASNVATYDSENLIQITVDHSNDKDKVQNLTKSRQESVLDRDQLNVTTSLKTLRQIEDQTIKLKDSDTSSNLDVNKYSKCRINLQHIDIAKYTLASDDSMYLNDDSISVRPSHTKDEDCSSENPIGPIDDSSKNDVTDIKGECLNSEEPNDQNEDLVTEDQTDSKDRSLSDIEPFDQTDELSSKNEARNESPEVCSVEDLLVDSDDEGGSSFVNYGLISPRFNTVHQSGTPICDMQDDRISKDKSSCIIDQQNIINADMQNEKHKSIKDGGSPVDVHAELKNNVVDLWENTKKCRVDLEKYTATKFIRDKDNDESETFAVPVLSKNKLDVPVVSNLFPFKCQSNEQEVLMSLNSPEVASNAPDGNASLSDQIVTVNDRLSSTESVLDVDHCDIDEGQVCDVDITDNNASLIEELKLKPKKCKIRLKSIDLEIHGGSVHLTNNMEEPSHVNPFENNKDDGLSSEHSQKMEIQESFSNLEDSGVKNKQNLSYNEYNVCESIKNIPSECEPSKCAITGEEVQEKSNIVLRKVVQPCRVLLKPVSFTPLEMKKLVPSFQEKNNSREDSGLDIRIDEIVGSQSEVLKINSTFEEERPDNDIKPSLKENENTLPTSALKVSKEKPQEVNLHLVNEDQKVKEIQEITLDSLNEKQKNVQSSTPIPEEGDVSSMLCKIGEKVAICPKISFVKLRRIGLPPHLIPQTEVIETETLSSEDPQVKTNNSHQIKRKRGYKKEEQWFPLKKIKTDGDDKVQSGDTNESVIVDVETTPTLKESGAISPTKIKVNRKMSGTKRKQKVYRNNKRAIWEFKNKLDPGRNLRVEKVLSKQWYPGPNLKRLGRRAGVQKLEGLPYDDLEADTGLDGGYWRKIGYREIKKKKMNYQFADEDSEDVDEKESSPKAELTGNSNTKMSLGIMPDNGNMGKKQMPKSSRVKRNSQCLKPKYEETNVEVKLSLMNSTTSDVKGEMVSEVTETKEDGSIPVLGKVLKEKQYKKRRSSKDGRIPREEIILVKVESSAGLNGGYWDNVGVRGAVKQTLNRQDSVEGLPARVDRRKHDAQQKVSSTTHNDGSNQTEISRDSIKSEQKNKQKHLKLMTKITQDIVNDIIETSVGRAEKEILLATKRESVRMKRVIKINNDIVNDVIKAAVVRSERTRIATEKKELTEKKREERMKKVNKINKDIVHDLIKGAVGRSERARIVAEKKELAQKKKEEKIKQKMIQQELLKQRRKEEKKERKRIIRALEKRRKSISNQSNKIVDSAVQITPPVKSNLTTKIVDSSIQIIPPEIGKPTKEIVDLAVKVIPSEVKLIYAEESESSFSTTSTADYCYPSETLKNVSSLSPRGAETFFDTTSVDIIICDITPENEELNYELKDGISKENEAKKYDELKLNNTEVKINESKINVHWQQQINVASSKKRKLDNEGVLNQSKQNKDSSDIGNDSLKTNGSIEEDKSMSNNWWESDDMNVEDTDSCEDIWKETDDILASLINAYSKKDSKLSVPFITPVEEADKVALETEVSETLKDIDQLIENDKAFNLQGNPNETVSETLSTDSETDRDIVNINKFGSVHISNSTTHLQTAPAKFPSPRHVSQKTCDEDALIQKPLAQPIESLKQDWSSSDDNECITKPRKKIYHKVEREPLVIRTSWGKAYKIPSQSQKMKGGKSSPSNNKHISSKSTKVSSELSKSVKKAKNPESLSASPHPAPMIETSLEASKVKSSHVNPSLSSSKGSSVESHSKRPKLEINERTKLPGRKESTKSTKKAGFLFDEAKYEKDNLNERNHVKALQDLTRSLKKDEDLQSQKMLIAQNPFYVKKQPSQSSSKRSTPEKSSKSPSHTPSQDVVEDVDDSNKLNGNSVASKATARSLIVQRPIVRPVLKNNEHVATTSTKHMTDFKNRIHGEERNNKAGNTARMSGVSKPKSSTSQSSRSSEGKQSTLLSDSKRKFNNSLDDLPPEKKAMLRFLDAEYEKILLEQGQFEN